MSESSKANVCEPDNPARLKTTHQAVTETDVFRSYKITHTNCPLLKADSSNGSRNARNQRCDYAKPTGFPLHGFTLIELLVVISIIAVLMAILMPALGKVKEQARAVVCKARLRDIGSTFRLYMQDNNGCLPPSWAFQSELNSGKTDGDMTWFLRVKDYYDLKRSATGSVHYNLFKCPIMEDWSRKNAGDTSAAGIYGYNIFFIETGQDARNSSTDRKRMWWKNPAGIKIPSELPLIADLDTRDPLNAGLEGTSRWLMSYINPHPAAYAKGWMNGDSMSTRHDYYGPAPNHGVNCNFLMADNHVESRNVCREGEWPWLGTTFIEQMSGRAFHPTRNP